jgi:hypothetical protein
MAMFDVYVEGATDPSPAATKRLAEVMSQRYGLPAVDLVTRLTKGRFRVKANIDHATATTYARDLEAVGARVTVAESQARSSTLPPPRPGMSQPPANRAGSTVPPSSQPTSILPQRPGSSLPPTNASNPNLPYASGLAAAFHENTPMPELGALDNAAASLASLDGQVDKTPMMDPDHGLPASIGPAVAPAKKAAPPKDVPLDLFAPPEAQEGELEMELAADEIAHRESRKRMSTPPASTPVVQTPTLRPKSTTSPPPSRGVRMASEPGIDEPPRWRFAAGVLASVVLGFIPAHCVASIREGSSDESIDAHVISIQAKASTAGATIPYAQLDAFREEQRNKKESQHRNIALVSMLIWGLAGAGIGYVWFRRVPWDKIKLGAGS